jgi:di/tricarboxylate transporter
MSTSAITLLIAGAVVVCFATEIIPLSATAILAACMLVVTGVLNVSQAFAGFSSNTVMLLIGMMIMGEACSATGIAESIGRAILQLTGSSEKRLAIALYVVCAVLSIFFNAMVIVAVFMPIIDGAALESRTITRKYTYLPMVLGSVFGGNLSLVGATCTLNASAQLEASYFGRGFYFFEPFPVAILGCVVNGLFFMLMGYELQRKWFDFSELPTSTSSERPEKKDIPRWKVMVVWATLVISVILFVAQPVDFGITALLGACILIITGCVKPDAAFKSVSWTTIFIVVGSLGLAKGLEVSGAGQIVASSIISICGPLGKSPFIMCILICILSTVLSNFMSDNAATSITVPIALNIALTFGKNPLPFVLACPVGAVIATATPVCKAPVTVTTIVGYRFKDYFRIGGICNLIAVLCAAVSFYILYFH